MCVCVGDVSLGVRGRGELSVGHERDVILPSPSASMPSVKPRPLDGAATAK